MNAIRRTFPAAVATSLALAALLVHAVLLSQHGVARAVRAAAGPAATAILVAPICGPLRDGGSAPASLPPGDCPICLNATAASFTPTAPQLAMLHPIRNGEVIVWTTGAQAAAGTCFLTPRNRGPPALA